MAAQANSIAHPGQPRFLITRLSALGDCIQTLPMACALRAAFPQSLIAWVVEKGSAPIVAACRAVDRVIIAPKRMLASPAASWQVRRELLPLKLEVSIDPQGLSKSAAVGWLSGAPRRIGLAAPAGREVSPWLNTELVLSQKTHMVERYLELLAPLGVESPAIDFGLARDDAAGQAIEGWLESAGLSGGFAVLNPGAGWDSKRWPVERLAEVAMYLGRELGIPSVVAWGGNKERGWAEEIVALAAGEALLAPPTTLPELTELLRRARLMIASDTGPLHLAAAVGTPSIGIYGTTRRESCGPYGGGNLALQEAFDGSPGRKRPGGDNWAVQRVSVELVCQAASKLLSRQNPANPHRFLALSGGRN